MPGRGLASVADDLVELLDHLGLDRVPVSGQSGGGPHVLALGARHPARISAATVVAGSTPPTDADIPLLIGINAGAERRLRDGGWEALYPLLRKLRDETLAGIREACSHRYPNDAAAEATPAGASTVWIDMKRLVAGIVVLMALVAGVLYYLTQRDDPAFLAIHGCKEAPLTAQTKNDGYTWPYGLVHSCRVNDNSRSLFSRQETAVLLIDTDRGLVVLRVEYSDLDMGRQYQAKATEIESAAGLSQAEKQKLQADQRARGGVSATPWILAYGDA